MLAITIVSVIVAITSLVALIINNRRHKDMEFVQSVIEDIADSFNNAIDSK